MLVMVALATVGAMLAFSSSSILNLVRAQKAHKQSTEFRGVKRGIQQVLGDYNTCRCNLRNISFDPDNPPTGITMDQIKTYFDTVNCTNSGEDIMVASLNQIFNNVRIVEMELTNINRLGPSPSGSFSARLTLLGRRGARIGGLMMDQTMLMLSMTTPNASGEVQVESCTSAY